MGKSISKLVLPQVNNQSICRNYKILESTPGAGQVFYESSHGLATILVNKKRILFYYFNAITAKNLKFQG